MRGPANKQDSCGGKSTEEIELDLETKMKTILEIEIRQYTFAMYEKLLLELWGLSRFFTFFFSIAFHVYSFLFFLAMFA